MNHQHGHPSPQDELFIRGIISGGTAAEQAMQELYLLHRKKILGYIANLVRGFPEFRGKPEDLMHDAFIVLVHRIEESDGQVRSLFPFWIGICKHLLLNQVKKDERMMLVCEPYEEYFLGQTADKPYHETESEYRLRETFDQLGLRCKQILLLWIERYPMHEIARKMELSGAPMARKIKHECFKKLKNLVKHGNKLTG